MYRPKCTHTHAYIHTYTLIHTYTHIHTEHKHAHADSNKALPTSRSNLNCVRSMSMFALPPKKDPSRIMCVNWFFFLGWTSSA